MRRLRVVCPAAVVTGGPECLHQFVHVATRLGVDAKIVYLPPTREVTSAYRHYAIGVAHRISDDPSTVVVVPEIYPDLALSLRQAIPVFWWLSWDHGAASCQRVDRRGIFHACQSQYAFTMLEQRLREPGARFMLSDYTRDIFRCGAPPSAKEDLVAYSPAKGLEYSEKIIAACPGVEFIAIRDMTPDQVREALLRVKVYIDFGEHHGKDRIPREAAVCGCCVITSSDRGSSSYFKDVPIPERYKFPTDNFDPGKVALGIRACIDGFERCSCDFEPYRAAVRGEFSVFETQVRALLEQFGCIPSTG